jgi:hypothetical protein
MQLLFTHKIIFTDFAYHKIECNLQSNFEYVSESICQQITHTSSKICTVKCREITLFYTTFMKA